MATGERNAKLLRMIADALGMDVQAFFVPRGKEGSATGGGDQRTAQLSRLVQLFLALPTEESRRRVLNLLEVFAAGAVETPPPGRTEDVN